MSDTTMDPPAEQRIAHIEGTVEQMDKRLDSIERRLDGVERRLETLAAKGETKFNTLETKFNWGMALIFTCWASLAGLLVMVVLKIR